MPASTRNWASKGVFGERIWSDRRTIQIPDQFASRVPNLANAYSCIGLAMLVYGLVALDVWLAVAGIVIVHGGKLWYIDRMVLLFEDMKQRDADYASWEYGAMTPRCSSTGSQSRSFPIPGARTRSAGCRRSAPIPGRSDPYAPDPATPRQLRALDLVPGRARAPRGARRLPPPAWTPIADQLGIDVTGLHTHAVADAPAADRRSPVLLLSPSGFSPLLPRPRSPRNWPATAMSSSASTTPSRPPSPSSRTVVSRP